MPYAHGGLCPMPYAHGGLCPMHVGYLMLMRKAIPTYLFGDLFDRESSNIFSLIIKSPIK